MLSLTCPNPVFVILASVRSLTRSWVGAMLLAAAFACAPGAVGQVHAEDIAVTYGRESVADGATFAFPEARQGRVVSRNFVIRNISGDSITLGTPVVTGEGFSARISKTFLRPNKKTRLLVQIDTAALGSRSATVSIPVLDSSNAPFTFTVTGDIIGPRPRIRMSSEDGVVNSGDDVFFGTARTGQTFDREFTIRNSGQQNLTLGQLTLTGSGFSVISSPSGTIKPGKTARMAVRMDAEASGSPQAVAKFNTNDPSVPEFTMMFSGSVAASGPAVQVIGLGKFLTNNQDVSFGTVTAGSERVERFTVRNTGNATLTLAPVESSDPGFVVTVQPPTALAPGGSAEFFVTYISSVGDAAGTITVTTNAAENNPFKLNVSGSGEPAADIQVVGLDRYSQDFIIPRRGGVYDFPGITFTDNFIIIPFRIRNVGTLTMNINGVSLLNVSPGDPFLIQTPPVVTTLQPGEETFFELGHISSIPIPTEARISIFSNDPNDDPFKFTVLVYVDPEAAPRPAPGSASFEIDAEQKQLIRGSVVDFGAADEGEPVEREFTITNTSDVPLRLGDLQIRGEGFRIGRQPQKVVAPGEDTDFTIVMEGDQPGHLAGLAFFSSNGGSQLDPFTFLLSGNVGGSR